MIKTSPKLKIAYFDIQRFSNVSHKITITELLQYFSMYAEMIPLKYSPRKTNLKIWFDDVVKKEIRFIFFNDVFILFDFFSYRYASNLDIGFILFPFIIEPWKHRWISIAGLICNKDLLLAFSHYTADRMAELAPGLQSINFPIPIDSEMIRQIIPWSGGNQHVFQIVFCSRLENYRHLHRIIPAIQQAFKNKKWQLHIISNLPEKLEYYLSIIRLISMRGVSTNVRWWGDLIDQPQLKFAIFKQSDILVHLSSFEGETFGRVVIEAMASGLPVITTDWQALNELIRDGDNGYLVSVRNDEVDMAELVSSLVWFMDHQEPAREMGEKNILVSRCYDYRNVFPPLLEKLEQLECQALCFLNPLTSVLFNHVQSSGDSDA